MTCVCVSLPIQSALTFTASSCLNECQAQPTKNSVQLKSQGQKKPETPAHDLVIARGTLESGSFEIHQSDLLSYMKSAPDVAPSEALESLIEIELIALDAQSRKFTLLPQVQEDFKRQVIKRYLREDFEHQFTLEAIPIRYIEQAKRSNIGHFRHPALRNAVHLLFAPKNGPNPTSNPPPVTGEQRAILRPIIERVDRDLKADPPKNIEDFKERLTRYTPWMPQGYTAKFERLRRFSKEGTYVPPFSEACFKVTTPHTMTEVIETRFGFHVAWVTEVIKEKKTSEARVNEQVRHRILPEVRGYELGRIITRLQREMDVVVTQPPSLPIVQ
jgi:hypothetical protein